MNELTNNIPTGHTKEDIKAREKLIKDFLCPMDCCTSRQKGMEQVAWCLYQCKVPFYPLDLWSLGLSKNETYEKASRSYESTCAVFRLTEILEQAVKTGEQPAKRNTRNQKQFEKLLIMQYGEVKLTVGLQRSNQDLVQYCITVPQQAK